MIDPIMQAVVLLGLLFVFAVFCICASIIAAWLTADHKPLGSGRRRNDEIANSPYAGSEDYSGGHGSVGAQSVADVQAQLRLNLAGAKERLDAMWDESTIPGYYTRGDGITPNVATHEIAVKQIALDESYEKYGHVEAQDFSYWERINGVWQAPEDDNER